MPAQALTLPPHVLKVPEAAPREGETAVSWILLSTVPVPMLADAGGVVHDCARATDRTGIGRDRKSEIGTSNPHCSVLRSGRQEKDLFFPFSRGGIDEISCLNVR